MSGEEEEREEAWTGLAIESACCASGPFLGHKASGGDRGKRRNGPSGVSRDHEHAANAMSPWGAGVS